MTEETVAQEVAEAVKPKRAYRRRNKDESAELDAGGKMGILQRRKSASHGRPSMPAPGMDDESVPTIAESMRAMYDTEPVLSRDKPVTGRDLDRLRLRLGGITVTDACWLFGLQRGRWYALTKQDTPLDDTSLAVLMRVFDAYPQLCPVKPAPKPSYVFHWLREVHPNLDQRQFSLLLGREKSAAHRWLKQGMAVSPKVERLFNILQTMILAGMQPMNSLEPLVVLEATSRGLDLTRDGMWSTPQNRIKPKRRKPGER